jgi:hypothetical protein
VSDAAEAPLHESLRRCDALALDKGVRDGRQVGLGHERGLKLDQHPHGPSLDCRLVKPGRDERLLGLAYRRDQKDEQGSQGERSGQSSAHAGTASTAKRFKPMELVSPTAAAAEKHG